MDPRGGRDPRRARGISMTTLTIVIASYNTKTDLLNCLGSLHDHAPDVSHEIVVVDNASRDESVEAVQSRWLDVRVIALASNVGFAAANNVGIRSTQSELVLLLNSDTIVPGGAIDRLVAQLRELPEASIVGPRIVDGAGRPELSYGRMISPLAELRQKALARFAPASTLATMTARTREVDWVTGACLLVRRRDAEAAGLLDERYFMYCEDVDFCAAVRNNGGRVYFTPSAEIVHVRGRSWHESPTATADSYRRSQLAFYRKHHPAWVPLLKLYLGLRGKLLGQAADK
jgi:N-acetylglucosaminyl-diphospho-decaprenol L-rhamnosyltransferase